MPGSATRTLRRVAQIEEVALDAAWSTIKASPQSFLDDASNGPNSPLKQVWLAAVNAAVRAHLEIERLADLLRAKSDAETPSAFAALDAKMAAEGEADAHRWKAFRDIRRRLTVGGAAHDSAKPDGLPPFDAMSAKTTSFVSAVRWVSERLGFPDGEIDRNAAPSATAVSLLQWAKASPTEFWTKYGPQLLPPRASQTTAEEEHAHDAACLTNDELCNHIIALAGPLDASESVDCQERASAGRQDAR